MLNNLESNQHMRNLRLLHISPGVFCEPMDRQKLFRFTLVTFFIVVWITVIRFARNTAFVLGQNQWKTSEPELNESLQTAENIHLPAITSVSGEIKSEGIRATDKGLDFTILGDPFGYITVPAAGDAGNYFLFAGSTVSLRWTDPPRGQSRYEFNLLGFPDSDMVIGADYDFEDGVSIEWLVPENLPGSEIAAIAYSPAGNASFYALGATVYSRGFPPQDTCVLAVNQIAPIPVHLEPDKHSPIFADLFPGGEYYQVYSHNADEWYKVKVSARNWINQSRESPSCDESSSNCRSYSNNKFGWVNAVDGFRLFGPCD